MLLCCKLLPCPEQARHAHMLHLPTSSGSFTHGDCWHCRVALQLPKLPVNVNDVIDMLATFIT